MLLEEGAEARSIVNAQQKAPLHLAAENSDADTAQILLDYGADPNAEDDEKDTPLHISVRNQDAETTTKLLTAEANARRETCNPSPRNEAGDTPLHIIAGHNDEDGTNELLEFGADVCAINEEGMTPLLITCKKKFAKITSILIDAGADPTVADAADNTPLHIVTMDKDKANVEKMLQMGKRFISDSPELGLLHSFLLRCCRCGHRGRESKR